VASYGLIQGFYQPTQPRETTCGSQHSRRILAHPNRALVVLHSYHLILSALTGTPTGCIIHPMIRRIEISKLAAKQLRKLPRHIVDNLMIWVAAVEHDGLDEVRKVPGYHDEPLKGDRAGQRSIRLSRSYRAIYEVKEATAKFVSVEEVSKHEY